MITTDIRATVLQRLKEVHRLCPEMRLGQLMATLGLLGEDATGHSLWDTEDEELASVLERFARDMERRTKA